MKKHSDIITILSMYIRALLLLTITLLFPSSLYGQKDYEEGYVVNMRNDTLYGKIKDSKPGPFAVLYKRSDLKKSDRSLQRGILPIR